MPAPYSDTGASRNRPDESREPSQRLGPGFHREPWIPAFAGMTILIEGAIYKQTLINSKPPRWIDERIRAEGGERDA